MDLHFTDLLVVVAVAFGAPLLLGLFPGLRLPSVVLELVAGIVIGPSVLGWVGVDEPVEVNRFTYVGDSTIETLRARPELGQSRVLFLEATHVGDTSRETSQKYGHTHLDELVELFRTAPETFASRHIVVKHFSTRYAAREIRDAHAALPQELRERVIFLIP